MPLALQPQTRQAQTQTQTLTPQMRQGLEFLQAPMIELRQKIRQEVDTNPTLELEDPATISIDDARESYEAAAAPSEERDFDEDLDAGAPPAEAPRPGPDGGASGEGSPDGEASGEGSPDGEVPSSPEETEGLAALGEDADYLYTDGGNNEYDPDAEERRQFLFDSIPARESLQEHLMLQLAQAALPEAEAQLCGQIVGSIDSAGYLRTPLAEIAQGSFATLPDAERALALVQGFTPAGVGARDLRECLRLQLLADPAPAARRAARILASPEAFEALAARRFDRAARLARVSPDEAAAALAELRRLDPRPGLRFSSEPTNYVRPEVEYRKVGSRWTARLIEDDLPRDRLSPHWLARAAALRQAPKGETKSAAAARREERRYLDDRLASGRRLIDLVAQRQATLLAVAQAIADAQPGFFRNGPAGLRPLTMAQIAAKVGVHETTVSRAVGGKYARTPFGLAELRSFFVGGLATATGEDASVASAKAMLKAMVEAEDPASPLSDQQLAKRFAGRGIRLARRTVAKYRDLLRIPPAHERKVR